MALKERTLGKKKVESTGPSKMEVGDVVSGYVMRVEEFEGGYGLSRVIIFKDKATGNEHGLYTAKQLDDALEDGTILRGPYTEIELLGKVRKKNKTGKSFNEYEFKVRTDDEDVAAGVTIAPIAITKAERYSDSDDDSTAAISKASSVDATKARLDSLRKGVDGAKAN